MSDEFELSLKREFLNEASEVLEELEEAFIEFERDPSNREVIDQIFRSVHNLKGSAMNCGFIGLGELAHRMENVFVYMREGRLQSDSQLFDTLLNANDRLRELVAKLKENFSAEVPIDDVVQAIIEVLAERGLFPENKPHKGPAFGFFETQETLASAPAEEALIKEPLIVVKSSSSPSTSLRPPTNPSIAAMAQEAIPFLLGLHVRLVQESFVHSVSETTDILGDVISASELLLAKLADLNRS